MNGGPLSGAGILIVEDEFLIAMDVEQLCREAGAEDVAIVRSAAEAIEAIKRRRPDVAVLDVMLSGGTVLDFAALLHREGVPFLFLSGFGDGDEIFENHPAVRTIAKPYVSAELLEALASAVNAGQMRS